MATMLIMAAILPKAELIAEFLEIIDMIRIWKVFSRVISVGGEQY